jgi:hypothetical protein
MDDETAYETDESVRVRYRYRSRRLSFRTTHSNLQLKYRSSSNRCTHQKLNRCAYQSSNWCAYQSSNWCAYQSSNWCAYQSSNWCAYQSADRFRTSPTTKCLPMPWRKRLVTHKRLQCPPCFSDLALDAGAPTGILAFLAEACNHPCLCLLTRRWGISRSCR